MAVATIEDNDPLNEIKHRDSFKDYSKMWEKISEGVNKLKQSRIKIEHPNPFKDLKELYGYLKAKSGTWAGRRQIINEFQNSKSKEKVNINA
ncbi:MAG: hypothetical protein QXX08_06835 [Candidatus Bathyarchaeia archaeon]